MLGHLPESDDNFWKSAPSFGRVPSFHTTITDTVGNLFQLQFFYDTLISIPERQIFQTSRGVPKMIHIRSLGTLRFGR